jgi:5-methylcytosine-specific restriction protein A
MSDASDSGKKWFDLDPRHTDPKRVRAQREKAQALKKSQWWLTIKNRGVCHYCQKKVGAAELTMDHVVPIARGGTSTKGNIVPSCRACNQRKSLATPVDLMLSKSGDSSE